MSKENVVRYYFKEVSLWRGTKNWRADKPEMYNRIHKGFAVMAKVTPGLKWVYPYKYFLKYQIKFFPKNFKFSRILGRGSSLIDERNSFKEFLRYKIFGKKFYNYKTEELHDIVKLHYHFVDWDKMYLKHMFYALRQSYEVRAGVNDFWEVVEWATFRMNEDEIILKPIKNEWGVLDL